MKEAGNSPEHEPTPARPEAPAAVRGHARRLGAALGSGALVSTLLLARAGVAATLVVPTDYETIQEAIDAANNSDVVIVEPGVYNENLTLRNGIDVIGRETFGTVLIPDLLELPAVSIRGANDLRFSNFTIFDATLAIELAASFDVVLANLVFDSTVDIAIDADFTSIAEVINNVFYVNGIAITRNTADVEVRNNIFLGNEITLTSPNLFIDNNTNVEANCWWDNADLLVGNVDMSYGTAAVVGDPLFVDEAFDFHLREDSPCIDIGVGTDVIDNTVADAGAYGGPFADLNPMPPGAPSLEDTSTDAAASITVTWPPNLAYLVTNSVLPGSYRVYYKQGAAGPPYDGTDSATGASPVDAGDSTALTLDGLSPDAGQVSAPELRSATGQSMSVALEWTAVEEATGYVIHYGTAATTENEVEVGNVTSHTVDGLTDGVVYRFAVSAITQATYRVVVTAVDSTQSQHESEPSEESSITLGGPSTGPPSNELSAIPDTVAPYPPLPDEGGCFIATAAYGADWHTEVRILRDFRDRYLLTHRAGRFLVAQYYRLSPPFASYLESHAYLKPAVRLLLTPLVGLALFLLATTPLVKLTTLCALGGIGGAVYVRRRRHSAAVREGATQ